MALWKNVAALGVAAGLAALAFRLVRRQEEKTLFTGEWAETMGEFPEETLSADEAEDLYRLAREEGDLGPNANPVEASPARAEDGGRLDPLEIAKAEDFQDWDDLGCQG